MNTESHSGFVAIVGRPSTGKSTLLNALCGHKVSIVSPIPQTTRNKVRGIVTKEKGQLVFVDTPGYHNSDKKFNNYMKELVTSSLEEIDAVLYVLDATRVPGAEEQAILEILEKLKNKTVIAVNKDDVTPNSKKAVLEYIEENLPDIPVISISALKKEGLDTLLEALFEKTPLGPPMYPEEYYTDQEPEFRIAEIIREKAIMKSRQELPHSIYVEIADTEISDNGEEMWIRAFIMVERETQKGMLVGKKGAIIKDIRQKAQKELKRLFPYKIYLDLRIKVNHKWRRKDYLLTKLVK